MKIKISWNSCSCGWEKKCQVSLHYLSNMYLHTMKCNRPGYLQHVWHTNKYVTFEGKTCLTLGCNYMGNAYRYNMQLPWRITVSLNTLLWHNCVQHVHQPTNQPTNACPTAMEWQNRRHQPWPQGKSRSRLHHMVPPWLNMVVNLPWYHNHSLPLAGTYVLENVGCLPVSD
jgi:hypothetical protein